MTVRRCSVKKPNGLPHSSPWQRHGKYGCESFLSLKGSLIRQPFRLHASETTIPMALPWAFIVKPVGLCWKSH